MAQVPEMAITKKAKLPTNSQEVEQNKTPALDEAIIFDILVRLPAHLVHDLRYVCKPWQKLIRNPYFIDTHLLRSEPGLLLAQNLTVDTLFIEMEEEKFIVHNLNFRCSKAWITASCNGLLLLRDDQTRELLYVVNPITKQSETLPLVSVSKRHFIGFDFTFIPSTKEYKVVRLTVDFSRKLPVYEILTLGSHTWKWVEGPHFRDSKYYLCYGLTILVKWILHWPGFFVDKDGSKYMFSLDVNEEKCVKTSLPDCTFDEFHNRFVEKGGFLALINQREPSKTHVDIWILKDFYGGEWVKQYCIFFEFLRFKLDPVIIPVACLSNGKVFIFKRLEYDRTFEYYSYDFDLQQTRLWSTRITSDHHKCLVHVNSLKWWKESS